MESGQVSKLLAGVGRAAITPPVGMPLMGYILREEAAHAVHDRLLATALVLSDGNLKLAWITCDLLFVHPTTVEQIRRQVHGRTGILPEHTMICCSHTHSGPVTYAGPDGELPEVDRYLDNLIGLVVDAVDEANRGLQDAVWGVGRGQTDIGVNRRARGVDGSVHFGENEQGARDPDLLVLRIDAVEGGSGARAPLAAMVNGACHAVCLGSDSHVISADWPGAMRETLESATGAMAGFVQGACADVNPRGGPQETFHLAQRHGLTVAEDSLRLYERIELQRQVQLGAVKRDISLPLQCREGQPLKDDFARLAARVMSMPAPAEAAALLDARFPWSARIEKVDGTWHAAAELQVFTLGDVALVAVSAEPFAEIGRQIKDRSVARLTLFAGYANGSVGYLPVPSAYAEGGYEIEESYVFYRLPAPLDASCAEQVVNESLTLIRDHLSPTWAHTAAPVTAR